MSKFPENCSVRRICLYWISTYHHVAATFLIRSRSPQGRFSLLLNHGLGTASRNWSTALSCGLLLLSLFAQTPSCSACHPRRLNRTKQRLKVGAITYYLWILICANTKHVIGNFTGKECTQLFYCLAFLSYSNIPDLPWNFSCAELEAKKIVNKWTFITTPPKNNTCFSLHKPNTNY